MSWFNMYVISAVLCSLVVIGHGGVITTEIPITTTTETIVKTSKISTITDPSTTSTSPKTTTTTTDIPVTTTTPGTPIPTPEPAPIPTPAPTQGTWSYGEKNISCIVLQMAAQINATYTKENSKIGLVLLNVPSNASVINGSCSGNGTQWITLGWPAPNNTMNNMTFVFARNDTTHNYVLKQLNVTLSTTVLPNSSIAAPSVELSHGAEWLTPLATSYRCGPLTALNMTDDHGGVAASLMISKLQEEAFRTAKGTAFSAARECGGGDVPDAVPIAVGCALGGLVLVVLVAYLVARRRSAARGYLSM